MEREAAEKSAAFFFCLALARRCAALRTNSARRSGICSGMRKIGLFLFVALFCGFAAAQANEFSVGGGAQVSFNTTSNVGVGAAITGSYGRRIVHVPFLSLYA